MKKIKLLIKILIVIFITSCSSDDSEIDSSFITDYSWKLINYNLLQPVDLNLDGIASLDMTEEFDCIKDESFSFNSIDQLFYTHSNLVLILTNGGDVVTERYECSEGPVYPFIRTGYFRMINENTIEITIDDILSNGNIFVLELEYENFILTQTITANYPVSYNQDTGTYNRESLVIEKVFIRD